MRRESGTNFKPRDWRPKENTKRRFRHKNNWNKTSEGNRKNEREFRIEDLKRRGSRDKGYRLRREKSRHKGDRWIGCWPRRGRNFRDRGSSRPKGKRLRELARRRNGLKGEESRRRSPKG